MTTTAQTFSVELRQMAARAASMAERIDRRGGHEYPLAVDVMLDLIPAGATLRAAQARPVGKETEGLWHWYITMPVGWRPREGDIWLGEGYDTGVWRTGAARPSTPPYGSWSEPGEPRNGYVSTDACTKPMGSHVVGYKSKAGAGDPLTCQRCGATREALPPSDLPNTKDAALRAGLKFLLDATAR